MDTHDKVLETMKNASWQQTKGQVLSYVAIIGSSYSAGIESEYKIAKGAADQFIQAIETGEEINPTTNLELVRVLVNRLEELQGIAAKIRHPESHAYNQAAFMQGLGPLPSHQDLVNRLLSPDMLRLACEAKSVLQQ